MVDMDFLSEIRATEQQAAELVSKARENAQARQEQARQEAALIVSQGREEATRQQHLQNTAAEDAALDIRHEALKQARLDAQTLVGQCAEHMEQAVQAVAERIVNANAHR